MMKEKKTGKLDQEIVEQDWERSSTGSPAGREIQKAKIRALVTRAMELADNLGDHPSKVHALLAQALVEALLYTRDFA